MLHYSRTAIEKLTMGANGDRPAPFPGLHPTRVLYYHRDGSYYIGKLYKNFYTHFFQKANKALKGADDVYRCCEFDRKHIVWQWSANDVVYASPNLIRMYHPQAPFNGMEQFLISADWLKVMAGPEVEGRRYEGLAHAIYARPSEHDSYGKEMAQDLITRLAKKTKNVDAKVAAASKSEAMRGQMSFNSVTATAAVNWGSKGVGGKAYGFKYDTGFDLKLKKHKGHK